MRQFDPAVPVPILYKIIANGKSCHGGDHEWSLPSNDGPGEWHEVDGDLVQCQNGFHLTTHPSRRFYGQGNELYEAEVDASAGLLMPKATRAENEDEAEFGPYDSDEWVARRVRLVRKISGNELVDLVRKLKPLEHVPEQLYAILEDAREPRSSFEWPVPKDGQPGDWVERISTEMLRSGDGIHITSNPNNGYRTSYEVWEVEASGTIWFENSKDDLYVSKARLIRRLTSSELDKLGVGVDKKYGSRPNLHWRRYEWIRKRDPEGASPAEQFVRLMAKHGDVSTGRDTSEDDSKYVREALALAIRGGLEFKGADIFEEIGDADGYYALAIESGNETACAAIEATIGRNPWLWLGKRLSAHSSFSWCGFTVRITSFMDAKDQIVACAYSTSVRVRWPGSDYAQEDTESRVKKRFVIDHDEFEDVAKRFRTYNGRTESLKKIAEWISNERIGHVNVTSLWFMSKEERTTLNDWISQRKDVKRHRKTRVIVDPMPKFLEQMLADERADSEVRGDIRDKMFAEVGPDPRTATGINHKSEWDYERAKKVWAAKSEAFMAPLLASRNTAIGLMERAMHAWAEANFAGQPAEYLGSVTNPKTKMRAKRDVATKAA